MPSLSGNNINVTVTTEADTSGLKTAESEIKQLGNTSKTSAGQTEELSSKSEGLAGTLGRIGAVFAGFALVSSVEGFGKAVFAAAGDLEQTNTSFQNLIGNKEKADKMFGGLIDYANTTPFEAHDVVSAGKQFLSAGEDADTATNQVKQLGDVVAAGGGNLQNMALAVSQVFGKGKMDVVDMKQIVNDGGAGIIKVLAGMHGGYANLMQDFQDGKVTSKDLGDAMTASVSQGGFAYKGAEKQAQTFNGQMSTLKDTVTQFGLKLIGVTINKETGLAMSKGGLFDKAKTIISDLNGILGKLSNHVDAVMSVAGAFIAVGVAVGGVIAAIKLAQLATALWNAISNANPWTLIAMAVVFALILILEHWQTVLGWVKRGWSDMKQWGVDTWQFIVGVWQAVAGWFRNVWGDVEGVFRGAVDKVGNVLHGIVDWAARTCDDIVGFFRGLPGRITGAIGNISSKVAGDIKSAFHGLHIPGFANGVHNFSGGLALVGEQGPELVNLPTGSSVYTNQQSQGMIGGSTNTTNIYGDIKLGDASAVQAFFAKIDQDTILAGRGMTPNRGSM